MPEVALILALSYPSPIYRDLCGAVLNATDFFWHKRLAVGLTCAVRCSSAGSATPSPIIQPTVRERGSDKGRDWGYSWDRTSDVTNLCLTGSGGSVCKWLNLLQP